MTKHDPVPILPVALLLQGRPCLVVGAGRVAARKASHLIEAGGRVTVIGEQAAEVVRDLHARGAICLKERAFQDEDVVGCAIVFAATDDADANRRVLEACRRRGILCGCADFHWRESDLISPAVLRRNEMTIAVSTGGRSCQRSRLIRDSLARHLAGVNTVELLIIGIRHQSTPLRRLDFLRDQPLEKTGQLLQRIRGVYEFLLLSTGNRTEVWALAAADTHVHEIVQRVIGLGRLEPDAFYVRQGFEAFEHTSLFTAGLLPPAPGENHLAAQVKDAVDTAEQLGWSGSILREWISKALQVSTEILRITASGVELAAIESLKHRQSIGGVSTAESVRLGKRLTHAYQDLYERLIQEIQGRHAGDHSCTGARS